MRINHPESKCDPAVKSGVKLMLCTPTLDHRCHFRYAASLVETQEKLYNAGIPLILGNSQNSCFVDMSRNLFISLFLESDCTHLLQIDSDMGWPAEKVLKLLDFDKGFISGIGRKKLQDKEPTFAGVIDTAPNGQMLGKKGQVERDLLIKMKHIGTAFSLIRRDVIETLVKKIPELRSDGVKDVSGYYFYHTQYNRTCWYTEDYIFCHLCNQAGIDVWCYPDVTLDHYDGGYNYRGNFYDYLKSKGSI